MLTIPKAKTNIEIALQAVTPEVIIDKKALDDKYKQDIRDIKELVNNFMNTFGANEIYNKDQIGFTLHSLESHDFGITSRIYAPYGMVLTDLDKYAPLIETGCKCQFLYEIPEHRQFAMATFIHPEKVQINNWVFNPEKVKPYEFFPGYSIKGEPVIFDLNKMPQILLAGQQRRGKNGAVDHAIVSWINSCNEKEITFYMLQCARNDLIKYKDCKQVYCYADTFEKIFIALDHIKEEMDRRVKLFEVMVGKGESKDNILHYNLSHQSNQIPYIIVVIDEFIELMPDTSINDKDMKRLKARMLKFIQQIGQFGGSLGVNYIILHQKPSAALMPIFIKNQSSVRLCFGFDDLTCCAIVLGDELAKHSHKLPPRKAFYGSSDSNGFLYTSNLTNRIRMFIEPSIQEKHRDLFKDLEKLNKIPEIQNSNPEEDNIKSNKDLGTAPIPENKKTTPVTPPVEDAPIINPNSEYTPPEEESIIDVECETVINLMPMIIQQSKIVPSLEFNRVDPIKSCSEKNLIRNIALIPNFVPYNPVTPKIDIKE
jgi:hypothetical protein